MTEYLLGTYSVRAAMLVRPGVKKLVIYSQTVPQWHEAGSGPHCKAFTPQRRTQQGWEAPEASATEMGFWKVNVKGRVRESILMICTNEPSPRNRSSRNSRWASRTFRYRSGGRTNLDTNVPIFTTSEPSSVTLPLWISPPEMCPWTTQMYPDVLGSVPEEPLRKAIWVFSNSLKRNHDTSQPFQSCTKNCISCYRDACIPCFCCSVH